MAELITYGNDKPRGKLVIRADTVKESNWTIDLKLGASGLPNNRVCLFCSHNAPFFEIWRCSNQDATSFYKVYDSEIINGSRNPSYREFHMRG